MSFSISTVHLSALGYGCVAYSGNTENKRFLDAFLTATFTVCIGAMAVVGSIQDGILGDWSTLALKGVLDALIIAAMTASMGSATEKWL